MANKAQGQPKLSPTPKFHVAYKGQDQPKPSPRSTQKCPVADNRRDSQPKLSPTPKFPLNDKACDFQTKLSPAQKFPLATKPLSADFGVGQAEHKYRQTTNTKH